jgi:putative CocE/NonD family hydrolase
MKHHRYFHSWRALWIVVLALALAVPLIAPAAAQDTEKISRPGVYEGYSEPIYEGWSRTSQYITVRDGTRLAVDIFRPTQHGVVVDDPLPVIWTQHRYHRANVDSQGRVVSLVDQVPGLQMVIRYGYVVGVADVRGGGASFGTRRGEFSPEETWDSYDLTEWFAAQPWCSGNVGMFGLSYLAITQYMAASTKPPHLKAIFPMMALFDLYSFAYPGGIFQNNFALKWGAGNLLLDRVVRAAPVDADKDGKLLEQAIAEHSGNWDVYSIAKDSPYRDSLGPENTPVYIEFSPSTYLDQINQSGVAIYTLGGWFDMYPRDALTWYNNLTVPQKIVMTPWSHNGKGGFDIYAEHLRWFDYWLKGIDNGIMDEPPIYYAVMGTPLGAGWRSAYQWPLPNQQLTSLYLRAGPTGSIVSANDGLLATGKPESPTGQDDYLVDYTTTTGTTTRWTDGYGGGFGYPDMTANDQKGLTYTTPPLKTNTEITGDPVVHLWVSSTSDDADFMVYLEEVDADGYSHYITEGVLRASFRALSTPPWRYMGLPYHSGFKADVAPLPVDEPVELVFDLLPTSNIFDVGHRIRITITGADADTYLTPMLDPPPTVSVYRNFDHASYVVLPIIPAESGCGCSR